MLKQGIYEHIIRRSVRRNVHFWLLPSLLHQFAIMQAFPGIEDIGLTLFLGGVVNLRRLHGFLYNNFDSNLIVLLQKS